MKMTESPRPRPASLIISPRPRRAPTPRRPSHSLPPTQQHPTTSSPRVIYLSWNFANSPAPPQSPLSYWRLPTPSPKSPSSPLNPFLISLPTSRMSIYFPAAAPLLPASPLSMWDTSTLSPKAHAFPQSRPPSPQDVRFAEFVRTTHIALQRLERGTGAERKTGTEVAKKDCDSGGGGGGGESRGGRKGCSPIRPRFLHPRTPPGVPVVPGEGTRPLGEREMGQGAPGLEKGKGSVTTSTLGQDKRPSLAERVRQRMEIGMYELLLRRGVRDIDAKQCLERREAGMGRGHGQTVAALWRGVLGDERGEPSG